MFGRAIAEFELARLDPVLLKPGDVRQDGTVRRTRAAPERVPVDSSESGEWDAAFGFRAVPATREVKARAGPADLAFFFISS